MRHLFIGAWILVVSGEHVATFEELEGCKWSAEYILSKYPEIEKVQCKRYTVIKGGRRI